MKLTINSQQSLDAAIKYITAKWHDKKHLTIEVVPNQRTLPQNSAIYLYFKLLADALNDAGYDVSKTLSKPLDIQWRAELVKELIWHPVQSAITGEQSTTKLNTSQVSEVYETINRFTASKFGISVDFPSKDHNE